jgi:isopentenyldiphosphate isomerase
VTEERGVLVDDADRVVGTAPRSEIRAGNLLHRGVAVVVRDPAGRIYLHRRTETKDLFPGAFDAVAGGMVQAGESYRAAAVRELAEELGVTARPRFLFRHRYRGERNDAWIAVYETIWDGPVVHQPEEVAWGRWTSLEDAERRAERDVFAEDHRDVFRRYLERRPRR